MASTKINGVFLWGDVQNVGWKSNAENDINPKLTVEIWMDGGELKPHP